MLKRSVLSNIMLRFIQDLLYVRIFSASHKILSCYQYALIVYTNVRNCTPNGGIRCA
jgi:hypothetical protein